VTTRTPGRSLAAAQTIPQPGDLEANLREHLRLVEAAAEQRVRVLVFPELSLTGYELDLADSLCFSERDARLSPLVEAAAAHGMTVIAGAPVRIRSRRHIGAFIVSPDRSIDVYTKQLLGAFSPEASPDGVVPPAEATVFDPGDRDPLLRFDGHAASVAVCADIFARSHPKRAADRGAQTYLASMFVIPAYLEQERKLLCEYAVRHAMAVVFANFGGPSGGLDSGGRSAVVSQNGEILVELPRGGAGLAVAIEDGAGWRTREVVLGAGPVVERPRVR
jgi:predicted amidohydrolase